MSRPLDLVGLSALMERSQGRPEIAVASGEGPVALNHPDLAGASIRELPGNRRITCSIADSVACTHGAFGAVRLLARRGARAPAFWPRSALLLRPLLAGA